MTTKSQLKIPVKLASQCLEVGQRSDPGHNQGRLSTSGNNTPANRAEDSLIVKILALCVSLQPVRHLGANQTG